MTRNDDKLTFDTGRTDLLKASGKPTRNRPEVVSLLAALERLIAEMLLTTIRLADWLCGQQDDRWAVACVRRPAFEAVLLRAVPLDGVGGGAVP